MPSSSIGRVALVAGVHGVVGLNILDHLAGLSDWRTMALGRRADPPIAGIPYLRADLLDRDALAGARAELAQVTHLFFSAYRMEAEATVEAEVNTAMLRNMLDALHEAGAPLERVILYQGAKAYGALVGPYRTPARESDPRIMTPLFYYDQEDLAAAIGAERGFTYCALRPTRIFGIGFGAFTNLLHFVAIYAAICRETGFPLVFPGSSGAYELLLEMTDAKLLGEASAWAACADGAANQIFNVTNGDVFRWSGIWPRIADFWGIEVGYPMPIDLDANMAGRGALWSSMVAKYGLHDVPYRQLVNWERASQFLNSQFEAHSSTIKIRQAGFHRCLDTGANFIDRMQEMRDRRLIP